MSNSHAMLWRRVDVGGHDACLVSRLGGAWIIEGTAVFSAKGEPSILNYRVTCDERWRSRSGHVSGWIGRAPIDLLLERKDSGRWSANGAQLPDLDAALDLDLGFTPATNTNAIKRMKLEIGGQSDTVAAWLDPSDWTVKPLEQSYKRLGVCSYDYNSPLHGYRAILHTDAFGFIINYPQLWVKE